MSRFFVGLVVVACSIFSGGQTQGSIQTFGINQTWSQGVGQSDITATAISLGGAGQFTLDPGFSGNYFDFTFSGSGTFSTINTQIEDYFFLDSYASMEFIGVGNFGDHVSVVDDWDTILVENQTAGVWGASHAGYLGFRSDLGNFGWIEYSFTRVSDVSSLTLMNGAYEDQVGVGIRGGDVGGSAIPEPGSLLVWGVLGLASTGLTNRRRRS